MRNKDLGIWQEYTWKDCYEKVKYFSLGLMSLGFEREDRLSIIGDNEPQWYWAEYAAQAAGGIAVGIFVDCVPDEVKYIVAHSESKFVVARDQEQVDKMLAIKDEVPLVKKVIYWDPKGLWFYEDSIVMGFNEVINLGKQYEETHPGLFEESVEKGKEEDVAIFCYTSGTTGLPKASMLTYEYMNFSFWSIVADDSWYEADNLVSFVPPAWVMEQIDGLSGFLQTGAIVNFPEEPETVDQDLREVSPNILHLSSRLWESINSQSMVKIIDSSSFKRFFYNLLFPVGYKMADLRSQRKRPSLFWRALDSLADWIVFRPLRDRHGLFKVRIAHSMGALLGPDVIKFFAAMGVNILNLYGTTEAGSVTISRGREFRPETVGPPVCGMEVRLSDEGEILSSPPGFAGYYKDPEETKRVFKDGWFHTHDAGYIEPESGHLFYHDRVSDLMELAGGEKFAPQYIEVSLKFNPYIRDAMVVGGKDKEYVAAIINIDFDNVGKWAEIHHIPYTTFVDLSQKPQVYDMIQPHVEKVNKGLAPVAKVKKFVLLHKEFDPDEAELTRTRKLRRAYMEDRYGSIISGIYQGKTEIPTETEVRYRDGRRGMMKVKLGIRTIGGVSQ